MPEPSAPLSNCVLMALLCDRCDAQLTAEGANHNDALARVRVAAVEAGWHLANRTPLQDDTFDLCSTCLKQFY